MRRAAAKSISALLGLLFVLLPLAGVEAFLRLSGRGIPEPQWFFDASLLVDTPIFVPASDGESMETNPLFVHFDNVAQIFKRHKEKGVLRVFCLGGSTTVGWPFHRRAGYPQWLSLFLKDALRGTPVEVVNAGVHGFDSPRELAVLRELFQYEPDVIIYHDGYNDYGDYWLRTRGTSVDRACLRIHAWLTMNSRLYSVLSWIRSGRYKAVSRSYVRLSDAGASAMEADFGQNVAAFVRETRMHGAQPVLMTLPYNAEFLGADHPWSKTIWPTLDTEIVSISRSEKVPLVDIDDMTRHHDLFVDSVHSTLDGYRYMARQALRTICSGGVALARPCDLKGMRTDADYDRELGIDDPVFKSEYSFKIALLLWGNGKKAEAVRYLTQAERLAPDPASISGQIKAVGDGELSAAMARIDRRRR